MKNTFDDYVIYFYFGFAIVYYTTYALLMFKWLDASNIHYYYYLNVFMQLFIALFLIVRYHPFKEKYELHKSDRYLIFGSAIFIIVNLGIIHGLAKWLLQTPVFSDLSQNLYLAPTLEQTGK